MPRLTPVLPSLVLLVACGTSVSHTVLNPSPRPMAARPIESVEVFTAGAPDRPRVDVAIIEVEEASSWSQADTPELLSALRTRAAKLGCDAVVVGGTSSREPQMLEFDPDDRPRARRGFWGTCVVWTHAAAPGAIAQQ